MLNTSAIKERTTHPKSAQWRSVYLMLFMFLLFIAGCLKDENVLPQSLENRGLQMGYEVTNLVSDVAEYKPNIIDPNLVNAWGIAIGPTGAFWISAAETELSVIYDDEGNTLRKPVTMEGDPTGQVFNGTTGFVIPNDGAARFIFATEYGTITAWRSGDVAPTMVDRAAMGASYTGIEIANDGTGNFIYLADNGNGKVDVFDENWNLVSDKPFADPSVSPGAKPFNIQMINGNLYVTYTSPAMGGFVNIFDTRGNFLKRFATGGGLNAPWGITQTPAEFGLDQAILVGNFGDGHINIFTQYGQSKGQLMDEDGMAITIEGLWALEFTPGALAGTADPDLYFTAGPDDEEHGIFGEIEPMEEEGTTGGTGVIDATGGTGGVMTPTVNPYHK